MAHTYNDQLDAFTLYHKIQESSSISSRGGNGLPALGHALAGSTGTAISHVLLYPLDLIITRLQVQRQLRGPGEAASAAEEAGVEYHGLQDAVQKIHNQEGGIQAFYNGVTASASKSILDSFLFFLAYDFFRRTRLSRRNNGPSLPVLDELSVGMLAGAFAKLVTTPIQNIVTRKQTAAMVAARDPTSSVPPDQTIGLSMKDIALQIRQEKGLKGFWSGYSASLVLTLNPAITMVLHNLLIRTLVPRSRRSDPGARLTFLLAAVSKATASAITYPFSLAKTRAQVSKSYSPEFSSPSADDEDRHAFEEAKGLDPKSNPAARTLSYRAMQARRTARRYMRLPTVIATVLHIAQTEGIGSLYAGLSGEVLKGFFAHGLTMLLKERIHTLIISLYFQLARLSARFSSKMPTLPTTASIRQQTSAHAETARAAVGDVGERTGNITATVYEGARNAVESSAERGREMFGKGTSVVAEKAGQGRDLLQQGGSAVFEKAGQGREMLQQGGSAVADRAAQGKELLQQGGGAVAEKAGQGTELLGKGTEGAREAVERGKDGAK
ncbi:mitochondrial carrier domain-containing protein [Cryomyces antarcticus]